MKWICNAIDGLPEPSSREGRTSQHPETTCAFLHPQRRLSGCLNDDYGRLLTIVSIDLWHKGRNVQETLLFRPGSFHICQRSYYRRMEDSYGAEVRT